MKGIKLPKPNFGLLGRKVGKGMRDFSGGSLRYIFGKIDQLHIKKGVDQLGLDTFVHQCAILAAGSGVITGVGGASSLLIGVPLDMVNVLTQQFRVTLAIHYSKTGGCHVRFEEFLVFLSGAIKTDAGVTVTKTAMEEVAQKLMVNMGARTTKRLIPVVGAVIGGSANYLYIKRVADSLKKAG